MTQQFPPRPDPSQWQQVPPQPYQATPTPAPKTPFWRTKKAAGLVLIGALAVGCVATTSGTDPAPAPTAPVPADRGAAFVQDLKSYPGLSTDIPDADLIGLAASVCAAIGTPGVTYDGIVATIAGTRLGPQVAPVLVFASLLLAAGAVLVIARRRRSQLA